jgi:hypothetical protein
MRLERKTKISNTINAYLRNLKIPRFRYGDQTTKPIPPNHARANNGVRVYAHVYMYVRVCADANARAAQGAPDRARPPAQGIGARRVAG